MPRDYDAAAQAMGRADLERTPSAEAGSPMQTVELVGFTASELLAPIEPETYLLPGLVPTEAYTLIAGALSSYKSTLLVYLALWRATGFDLLDLDPNGAGCDIGPALLVVYEDPDRRLRG